MKTYRTRLARGLFPALVGLLLGAAPALAQQGTLAGLLVDAETGEALIGANAIVKGTAIGTATDVDGRYRLQVVAGLHALVFSYIGYVPTTVEEVEVLAGKVKRIDVALQPEAIGIDEVVVEDSALRNAEAALLRERQKAAAVSDAISAEAISSIFHDFFGTAIRVEDLESGEDSRARLAAGDLALQGNLFGTFGSGSIAHDDEPFVLAYLMDGANKNQVADPQLRGISRTNDEGLDPRPAANSPALTGATTLADPFFTPTDYVGAFGPDNLWISGWTFLAQAGFLSADTGTAIEVVDGEVPKQIALAQNYPNPFNPTTTITFTLDRAQVVRLAVYDLLGREVAVPVERQPQPAGTFRVAFDASGLPSGLYLYRMETEHGALTRKMTLVQ